MKTFNKVGTRIEIIDVQEVRIRKTLKELRKEKQDLISAKARINMRLDEVQSYIDEAKALNVDEEIVPEDV
jgi:chaperonin cofactor prefoldin